MKIVKIEFVLENCDVLVANLTEGQNIIQVHDIKRSLYINGDYFETLTSKLVRLTFDIKTFDLKYTGGQTGDALHRLYYRDITSIDLHYDDGSHQQIYVPWKGDGYRNKIQYNKVINDGNSLEITFDYHYRWRKFTWTIQRFINKIEYTTKRRIK